MGEMFDGVSVVPGVNVPVLETVFPLVTLKQVAEIIGRPLPSWTKAIYHTPLSLAAVMDFGGRLLDG